MGTLAFDTHKFVKDLTAVGMKTEQAEVLASSYAGLLTDRLATKDDILVVRKDIDVLRNDIGVIRKDMGALEQRLEGKMEALEQRLEDKMDALEQRLDSKVDTLEHRLNARIAYAQVGTVITLTAVIGLFTFLA